MLFLAQSGAFCYVLFSKSSAPLVTGNLYVLNDAHTSWGFGGPIGNGGYTEGNSQCLIQNGSSQALGTSFDGNPDHYSIKLSGSFSNQLVGLNTVFLAGQNAAGAVTPWLQVGTYDGHDNAPQAVSVSPSSGTGTTQTFTFKVSDADGSTDVTRVQVGFVRSTTPDACYVSFLSGSGLYLLNDSGNAWLGPVGLGTNNTLANSQCQINAAPSSFTTSSGSLQAVFTLSVTFQTTMGGRNNVVLAGQDSKGVDAPAAAVGTWTLPVTDQAPAPISVTPNSGTGSSQRFTFVASDGDGASDLTAMHVYVQGSNYGAVCYVEWLTPSSVYLMNDAFTAWLGPIAPGTSDTVENSQCRVNAVSITPGANTQTLVLDLVFKAGLQGSNTIYLIPEDAEGTFGYTGQQVGAWVVP